MKNIGLCVCLMCSIAAAILIGSVATIEDGCLLAHVPHAKAMLLSVLCFGLSIGFVCAIIIKDFDE